MPGDQARHARLLHEAENLYRTGKLPLAAERCREIIRKDPGDARALRLLALALLANGEPAPARDAAERALKLRPGDPDLLKTIANTYAREGLFADAGRTIEIALAGHPREPALVAVAADIRFRAGDFDRAAAVLEPLITAGSRHIGIALSFAQLCPRLKRQREGIALLNASLSDPEVILPQRIMAQFALGDLHDNLGEFDQAFAAYTRGATLRGVRSDADAYLASVDRMLSAWSPERARTIPRASDLDPAPVFIVGMPRSGTSLTEQILASHPAVFGAGERETFNRLVGELQSAFPGPRFHLTNPEALTPRAVERMSRAALRDLHTLAPGAARIIDKNPVNYLHVGLISRLFPGARILHCVRDPLDTCLSSFFNNLAGPHVMAGDLALIGRWFKAYKRTISHWHSILDFPIMDVVYEDMVADQPAIARRITEFLGLDWRDELLSFHQTRRPTLTPSVDQVRRPMYSTSVARWRNYEKHLAPLREALAG